MRLKQLLIGGIFAFGIGLIVSLLIDAVVPLNWRESALWVGAFFIGVAWCRLDIWMER